MSSWSPFRQNLAERRVQGRFPFLLKSFDVNVEIVPNEFQLEIIQGLREKFEILHFLLVTVVTKYLNCDTFCLLFLYHYLDLHYADEAAIYT
jgi:hypothetical protein